MQRKRNKNSSFIREEILARTLRVIHPLFWVTKFPVEYRSRQTVLRESQCGLVPGHSADNVSTKGLIEFQPFLLEVVPMRHWRLSRRNVNIE